MGKRKWRKILLTGIAVCIAAGAGIAMGNGYGVIKQEDARNKKYPVITIGFSQVGAESGWRTGNSVSIKNTFSQNRGYDLLFEDAQQRQANQIKAIRSFIQQGVDYIILAPVVENGWDTVLTEAKEAGIPVIIADRMVNTKEKNLYTTWVGADFYLEGQKACEWMRAYSVEKKKKQLNIVHIQGTQGATAQIGRMQALTEAASKNGWNILDQQDGEFTEAKGQEIMEEFLQKYKDIDVVYCDNDSEALGAVTAIEKSGRKIGEDGINVVSFDATRDGLKAVRDGKISVDVECNPCMGEKIERIIKMLERGEKVNKKYYINDNIYAKNQNIGEISIGKARWKVTEVTDRIIREREY